CDAGLPIPAATQRIDLALTQGVPTFMQVFAAVTQEMQVESAILAEEIVKQNPQLHETLLAELSALGQRQGNTINVRYISHQAFKAQTEHSRAVIRSGECSPYANVILCAGVTF
ncbi:D-ribose pyranase, partial [Microbacterium arabinogalactanolyticum]